MARQSSDKIFEVIASDLTFLPIPEQRRLKAAFWQRFNENPLCEPKDITLTIALRLVSDPRLDRWWGLEGFKEWFRNQEEFRERAEFLAHLAMDALQDILITTDPKASSARVNAAKLVMELARKMPKATAVAGTGVSQQIAQMDRAQLEAYILRHTQHLEATPAADGDEQAKPS